MLSRLVSAPMRHREIRRQRPRRRRRTHWSAGRGWDGLLLVSPSRPVPSPLSSRRPCSLRCQKSHPRPTDRGARQKPRRTPATSRGIRSPGRDYASAAISCTPRRCHRPPKGERRKASGARRCESSRRNSHLRDVGARLHGLPTGRAQRSGLFPRCRCRRLRQNLSCAAAALHASRTCTRGAFNSRIL
jgi:hypothetical protein